MQAGFWLAQDHPALTPSPCLPACARCHEVAQLLANFCSRCGQDLRLPGPLSAGSQLTESWSQNEGEPLECLLANHALLAAVRHHKVDFWNPYSGARLGELSLEPGIEAAALVDNLLVLVREREVEVVHLTPFLRKDLCRYDRNCRFPAPGQLRSRLAGKDRQLAWLAGEQLVHFSVRPNGFERTWTAKVRGGCLDLAWSEQGLWCLGEDGLSLYDARGCRMSQLELPAPALSLQVQGQDLWVCGQRGELWRCRGAQIQRSWPGHGESCFAFAAGPRHVLQCSGRNLHLLSLDSGRQQTLQVPQPCVLPPLLGSDWSVLVSYEGMVYQLSLQQEQPRVVQGRRPFSSFEPIMLAPVLAGDKLVLAGPEGQLVAWSL
ncbi:hypothetical protein JST97_04310 [bacterium]|nr:hypothetical protein [bacterium]